MDEDKLKEERHQGKQAQLAYDNFVKPFINERKQVIFEQIEALSLNELDKLKEMKMLLSAMNTLDIEITNFIDTGKMARKMLEDKEESEE